MYNKKFAAPAVERLARRQDLRDDVLLKPRHVLLDLGQVWPKVARGEHLEERCEQVGAEDEGVAHVVARAARADDGLPRRP